MDIKHTVLMDYHELHTETPYNPYDTDDYPTEFKSDHQIIKCSGCDTISFRNDNWFSGCQDTVEDGTWEELYPSPTERTVKKFEQMPEVLTKIYGEVVSSYNSKNVILCATGIRAILEGVCNENSIGDNNLAQKIDALCTNGNVLQKHKEVLHKLRLLGNEAVHQLGEPTQKEIEVALDIMEHIIEDIYDILAKADKIHKGTK
jgi:hypothetical protein